MINLGRLAKYKSENILLRAHIDKEEVIIRSASLEDAIWMSELNKWSLESCEDLIKKSMEDERTVLFVYEADKQPFGQSTIWHIDDEGNAEYGRLIRVRKNIAKGGITIATKEVLRYSFEDINLNRIYLHVEAKNFRAKKVYYECGFLATKELPLERQGKGFTVKPELGVKAREYLTCMEITRERFEYLQS